MLKNRKMSTTITISILIVNTICLFLLYLIANTTMTGMMKQSEKENLHSNLNVQTSTIKEYICHQEDMLIQFSNSSEVIEFLRDPQNEEKREVAQAYTEKYYEGLDNWEGLYIGEWNTHVIAHSNPDIVGMVTREGEPLKELQNEMLRRKGLYNTGIIVSPASQKLVLSLYCPVFDYDGETILGYVGGGPYAEDLAILLESVVEESTEYYLVNVPEQMYIFAREDSLMAQKIEDETILSIISQVKKIKGIGDMEYVDEENGKSIAAYQYIPKYDWAIISCNSERNIYEDVIKNMYVLLGLCIASEIIITVLSLIFIRLNTKPLKYVEDAITQLKELKLEKDARLEPYIGRKSEVGQIATAIDSLYDSIEDMLDAEKEKQIAIAQSESKDKFLANMSHEIRTPINTIIGMNEMVLRENQDKTIEEYAYHIKSASHMLLGLINDILDLSKIEAGKLQIFESEYKVAAMLEEIIMTAESGAKQKDLKCHIHISKELPTTLIGDEIRIKQILNNLLSNAVKYTEEGSISLSVKGLIDQDKYSLIFFVEDTGIGISEEDIPHLFDDFQRLEPEKTRYIQGTGLGLHITKQLVENMNGQIRVDSERGMGSRFIVQIPQQIMDDTPLGQWNRESKLTSEEQDIKTTYVLAPDAKVLVVDDNEVNLIVIKNLLKRTQVKLDLAGGGKECLQKTCKVKYDLIMMDHMMPEMDGIETLYAIKEEPQNLNKETPVIMLTANALAGMEEKYLKAGFAGYISKPIDAHKMEAMMKKYL